jgi:putative flippase GtrA
MLINTITYLTRHKWQLLRFAIVGIVTFTINFSMVWVFYGKAKLDYRIAVSFAYILTVITHFYMNRSFTFRQESDNAVFDVAKYSMLPMLNYVITLSVNTFTVEFLRLTPYFGIIFSTFFTSISSFIVMKHFVFVRLGGSK